MWGDRAQVYTAIIGRGIVSRDKASHGTDIFLKKRKQSNHGADKLHKKLNRAVRTKRHFPPAASTM
jgi:hypothetical protein